jgi:hypothetical protein
VRCGRRSRRREFTHQMIQFRDRQANGFFDHPNHNADPIPTSYRLSEINFTSFCPDLTISPFIITPKKREGVFAPLSDAVSALRFSALSSSLGLQGECQNVEPDPESSFLSPRKPKENSSTHNFCPKARP